jgi:pimeloyl-ACP methyl ester carboxylesterase
VRVEQRYLKVGGKNIFVRDIGEGPPVVLFNGIGAHVEMWHPMERALEGMRIVSFDAPGTGRSDTRCLPTAMPCLARMAGKLLDQVGLTKFDLVGYSFGGALAQQFALQSPQRVRRLVLAGTMPGWGGVPGHLGAMLSTGTPLRYYSRDFYEQTAATIAGGRTRHDREHVRRMWQDRSVRAPSLTGYTQQVWAIMMFSSLPWLARIRTPTLIVVGDDDPLVPMSNGYMMAERMPRARVFVGRGEGHFQLLDDKSTALPAIREFLAAETLEDAPVWRSAKRVAEPQVKAQLRADGLGALPWGAVSAMLRYVLR